MNEHIITNLITGKYVVAFDWDNDKLSWGYDRNNAIRFGSKANAEVVAREHRIGWVVPA